MVTEGKPAPDFELTTDSGETVRLSDLRGTPVVLYFYPKDDTPGCTKQACAIRDAWDAFREHGAAVWLAHRDEPGNLQGRRHPGAIAAPARGPGPVHLPAGAWGLRPSAARGRRGCSWLTGFRRLS